MAYQNECSDGDLDSAKAKFIQQRVITDPKCPPRQTAAMETLNLCTDLAKRAAHLAEYVNGKLHPVMNSSPPEQESCDKRVDTKEYPPLFNDLFASLMSISRSLDAINVALDRTEL